MVRRVAVLGGKTAQLALGRLALAEGSEDGWVRAQRWLEAANIEPDPWASRYLAAALLSSTDAAKRDAARALELVEPLLKHPLLKDDPGIWQLAAAAYAGMARFAEAVAAQDKAIQNAQRYDWDLVGLTARRQAYAEGRRMDGPLLVVATRAARADTPDSVRRPEVCSDSPETGSRLRRCTR
jgi:tetratricopeptide (TPR) repeat protein